MPALSTTVLVVATDGTFKVTFVPFLAVEQYQIISSLVMQQLSLAEFRKALNELSDKWPIKMDWEAVQEPA